MDQRTQLIRRTKFYDGCRNREIWQYDTIIAETEKWIEISTDKKDEQDCLNKLIEVVGDRDCAPPTATRDLGALQEIIPLRSSDGSSNRV